MAIYKNKECYQPPCGIKVNETGIVDICDAIIVRHSSPTATVSTYHEFVLRIDKNICSSLRRDGKCPRQYPLDEV